METIAVTKSQAAALEAAAQRRLQHPNTKGVLAFYFMRPTVDPANAAVLKKANRQLVRVVRGLRKAAGIVPKTHGKVKFAPATTLQSQHPRGVASFGTQGVPQVEPLHNSTKLDMLHLRKYNAAEAHKRALRDHIVNTRTMDAAQKHRQAIQNDTRLDRPQYKAALKATDKDYLLLFDRWQNSARQRDRAKAMKLATESQRNRHNTHRRIATRRVL
jgi:hypothetical protein